MVHEWALAESVALFLSEKLNGKKARRIVLAVGRLQSIDMDVFDFALRELIKQHELDVEKIEYRTIEAELKCRSCGYSWKLIPEELGSEVSEMIHFIPESIHSFLSCPKCNSRDYEIVRGRGVYIEEMEVL
ncbi:MAG: hydrogenase nickel incorporation protein HypA [Fervidicoccaceae archaeon]